MKKFGEMSMTEVAEVLVAGKMPDGTLIDIDTAKSSLSRVVPILKDRLAKNLEVLKDLSESELRNDPTWKKWELYCNKQKRLIADAEGIMGK